MSKDKERIERDARGQYAKSQADRKSNGVASAVATVVTGTEDATMHNAKSKPSPDPGFDTQSGTDKRD